MSTGPIQARTVLLTCEVGQVEVYLHCDIWANLAVHYQ
jgi:hypothetical protein